MSLATFVTENYLLLLIPLGAALAGTLLGRLLREPHRNQTLTVGRSKDFLIEQPGGVVRGSRVVLMSADTHEAVEEVLVVHVPSSMPQDQREDSLRQASEA
ncbi:hypothetical protein BN2475_630032 [Paraburkholderia ribeironis]|uniref:Uncharacterized protein n=1 Tax=Paraburkholderia ribeironis TaxID=1247936 RepID=A0A1N7SFK2_9BURK|nr:hypothetical protein [Paraburkholderia ribeironis]SIT46176.1 hypothetical protein BN2475_630032 [Paraburkholderia ribeironis]